VFLSSERTGFGILGREYNQKLRDKGVVPIPIFQFFQIHGSIFEPDPSQTTLALWEIFSFAMLDLSKRNRWDGTY
jgi:hypothetical protein